MSKTRNLIMPDVRSLPMPVPEVYTGKRELKQRIMRSLQKLTGAFQHTRKKAAIYAFIDCLGATQITERLPYYSPDACPKRKNKDYLFFCMLAELVQAWWSYDEEPNDDSLSVIELALDRVDDVTKRGLVAYKICGKESGYWLESKEIKNV